VLLALATLMLQKASPISVLNVGKMPNSWNQKARSMRAKAQLIAQVKIKVIHIIELSRINSEAFFELFDKLDESKLINIEVEIENGLPVWRNDGESLLIHIAFIEEEKKAVADLSEKKITKALLNDIHRVAEETKADELIIAVPLDSENCNADVRNLLVYGFEKLEAEEIQKISTKTEYLFLKIDVDQEDDYVEL
jgi:predicted ATPase